MPPQGEELKEKAATRTPNLLENASIFSRLLFKWPYPLLKLGLERPLDASDLPEVMQCDTSEFLRAKFERVWQEELKLHPKNPSLHRALLKEYFTSLWYIQPFIGLAAAAKIVQALALGYLIESFDTMDSEAGYRWAGVLVSTGAFILFEIHHIMFISWRKGMQMRASCVAAIYAKSLRLSSTHSETSASTGRIMNLASNDVERFIMAAIFVNHLFWSPLQAMAILVAGCFSLGPAFASGFVLLVVLFVPFQAHLSRRFAYFRSNIAGITDKRVTFVSQAINGARVMKMSGYETRFLERIRELRRQEVAEIRRATRLKAWNETLFFSCNVLLSLTIFLTHVLTGGTLKPRDVFTVFTLMNIMQLELAKHLALGVMNVSEAFVSIRRIQAFIEFPELPQSETSASSVENEDSLVALSLSKVSCFWNDVQNVTQTAKESLKLAPDDTDDNIFDASQSKRKEALSDISLDFSRGDITCIIGAVGSGKSALIQALVGELPVHSGTLSRNYKTMAYATQDPWIMNGTVKENIIMGQEFDQEWYDEVVNSCGLRPDFAQFLNGDQTLVGDRGVQCSGGQRARIGLARALYRDADVLIVDDPLSAVDARVGRILFNEALMRMGVARGKCVILATHQHQYVNEYRCVLVQAGRILKIGSYEECVAASNGKLKAQTADDASVEAPEAKGEIQAKPEASVGEKEEEKKDGVVKEKVEDDSKERSAVGVVEGETYKNYARAMGGLWVAFAMIGLFIITQASSLAAVAMMGNWAERPAEEQDDLDILATVVGLSLSVAILACLRSTLSFELCVAASRKLHDDMTESVLVAKISFFDTNPLGRILNRFSADVGSNDDLLPVTLYDFVMIAFIVLGAIATTVTVLPFALVAIPPLLWYFVGIRRVFVTSTRELKRLEGLARSPIFAMLSESLSGIATIRSNDAMKYFKMKFRECHDAHTRAFFSFIASSRWAGFRMDMIMYFLMCLVSFLSVTIQKNDWFSIDPSILGLSISMLVQLAGIFQWCIRQSAEVVNLMVSVERVLEYGKLEPEAPLELESDKQLRPNWPSEGQIEVRDLAVRYRPALPPALDGATFTIPAGARVGVVGRTGSGKSTIVQTLFRLLEAEKGNIVIDGVDIAGVGLHRLRTKISVIPQVPTLFSGCTVRENLDLFGIHPDEAIKKALDDAHLSEVMASLPKGMHSMVSEGGSNFSVGQRQLLCLARAILNKNKILVLDEATASVDMRTDQLLHEALDESFGDATVLAVAHRLDTVIDHDYIVVLGAGKVLEFGSPRDLLQSDGHFSRMVQDTGDTMSKELRRRAFAATRRH